MSVLDTANHYATYALFYAGTPAQLLFIGLYLTRPWRKYGPTRAVMTKSVSLFLLMSQGMIVLHLYGLRPLDWPWWLLVYRIVGDVFLLTAIYYQLWVNVQEMLAGYREQMLR
jgi:hypothetical protein